jgi:hypothetical protein
LKPALYLTVLFALVFSGAAASAAEDAEVTYLLDWVAASDCTFVRNGEAHEAAEAAEHLAMKYRRVRRWIDSADEFIDRIASGSSLSGRDYLVQCPGVAEQTSRAWLSNALMDHRNPALTAGSAAQTSER